MKQEFGVTASDYSRYRADFPDSWFERLSACGIGNAGQTIADIAFIQGHAEALPLQSESFQVVTAGQCWHWFDGPLAAGEFARVVKCGGTVVTTHFDWLPFSGNVVDQTENLIEQHNPDWYLGGGNGFHIESIPYLQAAGLEKFQTFSYEEAVEYDHESWRGRIRASAGVASLFVEGRREFDLALAELLTLEFPQEPLAIPHRVFALWCRKPT